MSSAQVLVCGRREIFAQSLRSVKRETTVCVVSCVSNFLTSSDDTTSTISLRVDPIFDEVFSAVLVECETFPSRHYLLCPPMYRQSPLWYRDNLAEVMRRFSAASKRFSHANMRLMPSFPSPTYEADGVHLTAYSGLEFVLHLFDASKLIIESLSASVDVREATVSEASRLIEDRMMALEQDHRRLSGVVELKTAVDSEADDFLANERMLNTIVVSGLTPIQGRLSGKEWQERAQRNVLDVLKTLMNKDYRLRVVRNSTGMAPSAPTTYTVEFYNVEDPAEIRSKFGTFFAGGADRRPPALSRISIQNSVTKATRIRISILKLLAKRYQSSNPDGKAQVIGYNPRPLLRITPPDSAKDRRIRSFNFIEAIQKFPTNFTEEEIGSITKRAYASFPNKLRSTFVVLSDDFPGLGSRPTRQKRQTTPPPSGIDRRARVEVEDEFAPE